MNSSLNGALCPSSVACRPERLAPRVRCHPARPALARRVSCRAPHPRAPRVIQSAQPPLLNALCHEREGSPPKTPQALTTASESDRRSFALIAVAFGLIGLGALDDTRRARRSGALDDTRHARRSGALDDTPREGWVLWMTRGAWGSQRGVADRLCDPPDSKRQERRVAQPSSFVIRLLSFRCPPYAIAQQALLQPVAAPR